MSKDFLYIADGKLFSFREGAEKEIPSAVLEGYKKRLSDSIQRNEWKQNGSGAAFMGTARQGADLNSQLADVHSVISNVASDGDTLIYSIDISGQTGLYRTDYDGRDCGIVQSSGTKSYFDFDIYNGRIAFSSALAGQSHIGTRTLGQNDSNVYTDGDSWDFQPVFSRHEQGKIYFCSSGLKITNTENNEQRPMSYADIYRQIMTAGAASVRGPASINLLDPTAGTLDTVLEDSDSDYLHPQSMKDGTLYYIRRPYTDKSSQTNPLGCLLDIVLLPFRILKAFFGFFSVFSMKYSGQPLDRSTKAKDEKQMFIDGNMIDAGQAMKENAAKGEEDPGIIPRSWELHRLSPDGKDEIVRRGVAAYRVYDDGSILFSNGSAVKEGVFENGKFTEKKICSAKRVTFIQ